MELFINPQGLNPFQLLFLLVVYGYILFFGSNLIGDGSELLLLIPSLAGIVGSVVLPVLGAVPDGAIILFSGLGPDAQESVAVGVGALAGSTIMLLTLPWFLTVLAGRVNLTPQGTCKYKTKGKPKVSPEGKICGTGIQVEGAIKKAGEIMLITSVSYLVIQAPAFRFLYTETYMTKEEQAAEDKRIGEAESIFALVGFAVSTGLFIWYLWIQIKDSGAQSYKIDEVRIAQIKAGNISLDSAVRMELERIAQDTELDLESSMAARPPARIVELLRPFFNKYANQGKIDKKSAEVLFDAMHSEVPSVKFERWFYEVDIDGSETIELEELCTCVMSLFSTKSKLERMSSMSSSEMAISRNMSGFTDSFPADEDDFEEDSGDEEEEETPEEFKMLQGKALRNAILRKSFSMMGLGTGLVLLFSDPMVDVLAEVGVQTGIPAFYVSFVLAPLASNASELIAALKYAGKKTRSSATIACSALLGAACMNNTFCLGVFLLLVWIKKLAWKFSAEVVTILFAQMYMFIVSRYQIQTMTMGFLVLALYPLSLLMVWFLENILLWQ